VKNVCIVGYGNIGPLHARSLEETENAKLYAVCDVDAQCRQKCKEQYPVKGYEDFEQMLQDKEIDSVHICTPHYLHYDMVRKALAAGKDVVVEKPVTITKEQFSSLQSLEGAERVCVVFQNRLNPCVVQLKEFMESGKLGKVIGARTILTWCRTKEYYQGGAWRGRWETEGGCLLINQAIHSLDFMCYLLGKVKSVQSCMNNFSLEGIIEAEDTFTARMEFECGAKAIFFATNAYVADAAPLYEIVFEKGTARYMDGKLWINDEIVKVDAAPRHEKAYWGNGHSGLIKRYYDEQKYFSLNDVTNTMEALFAMYDNETVK